MLVVSLERGSLQHLTFIFLSPHQPCQVLVCVYKYIYMCVCVCVCVFPVQFMTAIYLSHQLYHYDAR